MKNIWILIFCFISVSLFSQTYEITYYVKQTYRAPVDSKYEYIDAKIKRSIEHTTGVFRLLHENGKSVYTIQYVLVDKTVNKDPKRLSGWGAFYKDFTGGFYVQVADFIGKNRAVRESFDVIFDWHIDPVRDTMIYGISCKRASTQYNGNLVVAWFAESIPIMDGPLRYAGLPGLILRTETNYGVTEVAGIKILNKASNDIIIPVRQKYVSFKEFLDNHALTVKGKRIKKD